MTLRPKLFGTGKVVAFDNLIVLALVPILETLTLKQAPPPLLLLGSALDLTPPGLSQSLAMRSALRP